MGTGANIEAHHIIPWTKGGNHAVVQSAALAGFHLNDIRNGIGLQKFSSLIGDGSHGNHPKYDTFVVNRLNEFANGLPNFTPEQANAFITSELIPEFLIL